MHNLRPHALRDRSAFPKKTKPIREIPEISGSKLSVLCAFARTHQWQKRSTIPCIICVLTPCVTGLRSKKSVHQWLKTNAALSFVCAQDKLLRMTLFFMLFYQSVVQGMPLGVT
jgi:hypothetical protein